MGLVKSFFSQCARPEGFLGRVMLRFMNFGHAPLTNWGLSLVEIHDGWTMLDIGCGGGATLKRLLKRSKGMTSLSTQKAASVIDTLAVCITKQFKNDRRLILVIS